MRQMHFSQQMSARPRWCTAEGTRPPPDAGDWKVEWKTRKSGKKTSVLVGPCRHCLVPRSTSDMQLPGSVCGHRPAGRMPLETGSKSALQPSPSPPLPGCREAPPHAFPCCMEDGMTTCGARSGAQTQTLSGPHEALRIGPAVAGSYAPSKPAGAASARWLPAPCLHVLWFGLRWTTPFPYCVRSAPRHAGIRSQTRTWWMRSPSFGSSTLKESFVRARVTPHAVARECLVVPFSTVTHLPHLRGHIIRYLPHSTRHAPKGFI
ncbi:hypothetical protein BV20DRAFT_284848 [Pilatotrama ljubarskyi]|nr:hypothetical protein BV20DRAFT_284848 [Pilatotrama ljubarskyi]